MCPQSRGISNRDLAYAVRAAIDADARFQASGIDITVQAGVVTLTGLVPNPALRAAAAQVVLRTKGVTGVVNRLRVQPFVPRLDADVTADVVAAITANAAANPAKIDVQTEDGVVYLRGTVTNVDERQRVDSIARAIEGVRDVIDDLMIAPAVPHPDVELARILRARLNQVLKSSTAERVHVEVRHGIAYLEGNVSDPAIRWALEDLARWTPGIVNVVDNLDVTNDRSVMPRQQ